MTGWSRQSVFSSGKHTAVLYLKAALVTPYFSVYLISDRRYLISCVIVAIAGNSFVFVLVVVT